VTPEQAAAMHATHAVRSVGAHTVGAPDGGPGLLGVGWSTQHGDLRVPHFFGLHGLQIIPFIGWLALRRRRLHTSFVFSIAGSYLALIGILTWQALRGQSVIEPDGVTLAAFFVWLGASVVAIFWTQSISPLERAQAAAR
jgi:hypothetical protein